MYLLEKLELLHASGGMSNEAVLATYFINRTNDRRNGGIKNASLETGISKSSIIRFCQSAGFSGFSGFSECLRQDIDEALAVDKTFDNQPDNRNLFENIQGLVEKMNASNAIYFFGPRDFIQILSPTIRLLRQKHNVYTQRPFSAVDQANLMTGIREDDLVILIEPYRTWRSLNEAGKIHQEMPVHFPSWKGKTAFFGAQKAVQAWMSWEILTTQSPAEQIQNLNWILYHLLEGKK